MDIVVGGGMKKSTEEVLRNPLLSLYRQHGYQTLTMPMDILLIRPKQMPPLLPSQEAKLATPTWTMEVNPIDSAAEQTKKELLNDATAANFVPFQDSPKCNITVETTMRTKSSVKISTAVSTSICTLANLTDGIEHSIQWLLYLLARLSASLIWNLMIFMTTVFD